MRISAKGERAPGGWLAAALGSCGLAVSWFGLHFLTVREHNSGGDAVLVVYILFLLAPLIVVALAVLTYAGVRLAGASSVLRFNSSTSVASAVGAVPAAIVLFVSVQVALAYEKYSSTNALSLWQFDTGILLGALSLVVVTALASRWSGGWLQGALAANGVAFVIACFFAYRLINWYVFVWFTGS